MAHIIRGLIVDDNPKNISSVSGRLSQYLSTNNWQVNWTRAEDADHAHALISEEEPFDLVVLDLLFLRPDMDDDEARGLELIDQAKEKSARSYIFAITTGDSKRRDLLSKARRFGAHKAILRMDFSMESEANSPRAVADAIRRHLLANGTVTEVTVHADRNDPAVQSLLFEVKDATLAQLHRRILETTGDAAKDIHVSFLSPGASGAAVCAVTAKVASGRTVRHVVKLSRAGDALKTETQRALQARLSLPNRFVMPIQPDFPVGPVNGWHATGAPLDQEAVTLRTWLASGPPGDQVAELMELLFTECLGRMYEGTMEPRQDSAVTLLEFPHYKQRLVLQAMDELAPTLTRPEGGALGNVQQVLADLNAFATEQRLPGILQRSLPHNTMVTQVHGDLHGGNVLVYRSKHPSPALIDFSEFGPAHWTADPARLAVDLLMRGVDAGAESMLFTRFATWRGLVDSLGQLSPANPASSDDAATNAALSGLSWLVRHLRQVCPALNGDADYAANAWEWHIALCTFLLRTTYHHEVPPPKRAMALVAAHDQLLAGVTALAETAR